MREAGEVPKPHRHRPRQILLTQIKSGDAVVSTLDPLPRARRDGRGIAGCPILTQCNVSWKAFKQAYPR